MSGSEEPEVTLAVQLFTRNVELEKENRLLREELFFLKNQPSTAVMFEPTNNRRKPWKDLRKRIEDAAKEKYDVKDKES